MILLEKTSGDVIMSSGAGTHNCTFLTTDGNIEATVGGAAGANHLFTLADTNGAVTINADAGDRIINANQTVGSITANLGDGDDTISLKNTQGYAKITSGEGSHDNTFVDTAGIIEITVGNGIINSFILSRTEGSIQLNAGNGDHVINASETDGNLAAELLDGNDQISLYKTQGKRVKLLIIVDLCKNFIDVLMITGIFCVIKVMYLLHLEMALMIVVWQKLQGLLKSLLEAAQRLLISFI